MNSGMKRTVKILFRTLLISVCLAFVALAFLPTVLSTSWGKDIVLTIVNGRIPGNLEIEALSVKWMGPQSISEAILKDPEKKDVISVQSAQIDASLFALLIKREFISDLQITSMNAYLVADATGSTNFDRSLGLDCCLGNNGAMTVMLKNVNGDVHLKDNGGPLKVHLSGETQQDGDKGNFVIDAELKGLRLKDILVHGDPKRLLEQTPGANLSVSADIVNFPVKLLDQVTLHSSPDLSGAISELLGSNLNVRVDQSLSQKELILNFQAEAKNVIANAQVKISDDVSLVNPVVISLDLTPKLIERLGSFLPQARLWKLKSPTKAVLTLSKLIVPTSLLKQPLNTIDLAPVAITALLEVKNAFLNNSESQKEIAFELVQASLDSNAGDSLLNAKITGSGRYNGQPIRLDSSTHFLKTFNFKNIQFDGNLVVPSFRIDDLENLGSVELSETQLQYAMESFPHVKLSFSTKTVQKSNSGLLYTIFGKTAAIALQAALSVDSHIPEVHQFDVKLNSELSQAHFKGQIKDGHRMLLTAPASVSYLLSGQVLENFGLSLKNYTITQNTPIELVIAPSSAPINIRDLSSLQMSGSLNLKTIALASKSDTHASPVFFDLIKAQWAIDGEQKRIALNFSAIPRLGTQGAAKLSGNVVVENWVKGSSLDFHNVIVLANTQIHQLPVAIFNNILEGSPDIASLLGNSLNASASAEFRIQPTPKSSINIEIQSEQLNGSAALTYKDDKIYLNENIPTKFLLNLTPQGYLAIRRWINKNNAEDFALGNTAKVELHLRSLKFPLADSSGSLPFLHSAIDLNVSIDKLVGVSRTRQSLTLQDVSGQFSSKNLSENITFDLHAISLPNRNSTSIWSAAGLLENAFSPNGSINTNALSLKLDANFESIPLGLICPFICLDPTKSQQIEAVFGDTLNAKFKTHLTQMNGPAFVDVNGKNGQILLDGYLTNGLLTLQKDLIAKVSVTPEFSKHVLQQLFPMANGMLNADEPLTLKIDKQGFALPIKDLNITAIRIPQASLSLGKVRFSSQSQLAKIFSLLTSNTGDQLKVWLTPLFFSLENGIVTVNRLDMLVNERYPLATWGEVNIGRDRVNMVIGLLGAGIRKAFNVSTIPNDYILQLPLRGTLSDASIDKTKSAARLSALVAQSQGGPEGLVIGTVLHIASGGLTENPVPKPTTNPLPWSDLLTEEKGQESSQKDQTSTKDKNPLKEIKKGAESLLKNIFNK